MANNVYNNAVKIARLSMDCLRNNLTFTKFVNRNYEPMFKDGGAKGGDTINVRIPPKGYSVRHGATAAPQGYLDTYVPITLAQHGADMNFTTKDLRLCVEDGDAFQQNVLNPLIAPVANYIDYSGLSLYTSIPNFVGAPGTLPSNLDHFLDAGAVLDEHAVPRDGSWAAIMHPRHQAGMLKGTTSYYNPQTDISEQFRNGVMGRLVGGFKFSTDQNCPTHTTGKWTPNSTAQVNATISTQGNTAIVIKTLSSGAALKKGDIVSFAGVYEVNPISKVSTGNLRQFTVTADANLDSTLTLALSPAMYTTGPNQNIDAFPQADASVYFYGATANTYSEKSTRTSLLFHPDAFGLCCVDLPKPESANYCVRVRDPKLDIAIRLIQWYNGSSDEELYRLDVLFGWATLRPDFACRIQA